MSQPTCRVCGCTENDCRGCLERTGEPCFWVEPDLCSACTGAALIVQERIRQLEEEGYDAKHDDEHKQGELAEAAACYAGAYQDARLSVPPDGWPWGFEYWKPSPDNRVRELVKAGALIAAEIDRLNRIPGKKRRPS